MFVVHFYKLFIFLYIDAVFSTRLNKFSPKPITRYLSSTNSKVIKLFKFYRVTNFRNFEIFKTKVYSANVWKMQQQYGEILFLTLSIFEKKIQKDQFSFLINCMTVSDLVHYSYILQMYPWDIAHCYLFTLSRHIPLFRSVRHHILVVHNIFFNIRNENCSSINYLNAF